MKRILLFAAAVAVFASCCRKPEPFSVIPMPSQVELTKGTFCVKGTDISVDQNIDELSQKAIGRFVYNCM